MATAALELAEPSPRSWDDFAATAEPRPVRRTALDVADPRGDIGLTERRPYADLVRLRITENGESALLTVTVADAIRTG